MALHFNANTASTSLPTDWLTVVTAANTIFFAIEGFEKPVSFFAKRFLVAKEIYSRMLAMIACLANLQKHLKKWIIYNSILKFKLDIYAIMTSKECCWTKLFHAEFQLPRLQSKTLFVWIIATTTKVLSLNGTLELVGFSLPILERGHRLGITPKLWLERLTIRWV